MTATTQQALEFDQIKEGVVILKNKSLRGVLMISSLNFALKAEQERRSIIFQFQSFLNTLDFPLEMAVQSRKLNISSYLKKLKNLEDKEKNQLLKTQIREYSSFIRKIIKGNSIMSKTFYVVVPFHPNELRRAPQRKKDDDDKIYKEKRFQRSRSQLLQRMQFLASGLKRCGLSCQSLSTAELIELFWGLYHPEKSEIGYYPNIPSNLIK
jgi:hypothetical protein